jgi:hypothetical protein
VVVQLTEGAGRLRLALGSRSFVPAGGPKEIAGDALCLGMELRQAYLRRRMIQGRGTRIGGNGATRIRRNPIARLELEGEHEGSVGVAAFRRAHEPAGRPQPLPRPWRLEPQGSEIEL